MAEYRFTKTNRLLSAKDFSQVFNASQNHKLKASNKHFMILARLNECDEARIGFAVAKKKVKLATSRNRIKRILREQFRLHKQHRLNLDIVVMANSACITATNNDLVKSYHLLWDRLQKLHKKGLSS